MRSCIIDEEDFSSAYKWAAEQNYVGRWMPECSDRYEMFYREYYWSPAYHSYDVEGLTRRELHDRKTGQLIANVDVTAIGYLWEAEEDHSKETSAYWLMPSKQLFEGLKMQYGDREGEFLDEVGKALCFDAAAIEKSRNYLLIRKKALMDYLKTHHKKIIWYILGEKNIIGLHNYQNLHLPMWLVVSGTYTLDENGRLVGSLRCSHEK